MLEEQKQWVIGHKIKKLEVDDKHVRILMENGLTLRIDLVKNVSLIPKDAANQTVNFEAKIVCGVGVPGIAAEEKEESE